MNIYAVPIRISCKWVFLCSCITPSLGLWHQRWTSAIALATIGLDTGAASCTELGTLIFVLQASVIMLWFASPCLRWIKFPQGLSSCLSNCLPPCISYKIFHRVLTSHPISIRRLWYPCVNVIPSIIHRCTCKMLCNCSFPLTEGIQSKLLFELVQLTQILVFTLTLQTPLKKCQWYLSAKNCNGLGNHPPKVEKEGEGSFTHYWQLKDCLLIVHAAWQAKGQLANCLTWCGINLLMLGSFSILK